MPKAKAPPRAAPPADEHDPALASDVAAFMKNLDFGGAHPDDADDDADDAPPPTPPTHAPAPAPRAPDARVADAAAKVAATTRAGKTTFLIPPTAHWYTALPALAPTPGLAAPAPARLAALAARGAALLAQDAAAYAAAAAHTSSAGDARFLARVLAGGTLADRLSALTLLAQGAPAHNARALDALRALAAKRGRAEGLKALRAVADWWGGGGAPPRKLRYFRDQPLAHPAAGDAHLALWHFEDWLKKYFFSVLQLLEALAADALPYVRAQAAHLVFQLLRDTPEQEHNLLRLLVHRLADADKAVASKASHLLLQLLQAHPRMKGVVVHEVSALVLKPPAAPAPAPAKPAPAKPAPASGPAKPAAPAPEGNTHARYYAVITFNQIVLLPGDRDVAARLVDVYFALFRALLGEGDVPGAAPPAPEEPRDFTPKKRRGSRPRAGAPKGKGKGKSGGDLGFQELPDTNAKLVSQILTGVNRALPFAKTEGSAGFAAHIDTLFRITHTATFAASLQALALLQRVAPAADRVQRALYASLADARLAASAQQARYLNLLFRALRAERSAPRAAAFVRRLVQVLGAAHQPPFICGGLFLLGELLATAPELRDMTSAARAPGAAAAPYDPRKRDPQFAHALASCLWELLPLAQHYHPAVALHARQLLARARVTATADVGLHTLAHFLDRFVYRNARRARARGASAMQPAAGSGGVRGGRAGEREGALNAEAFRRQGAGDVPADQVFFHRFFARKHEKEAARLEKAARRRGRGPGAEGAGDSDAAGASDAADESASDAEEAEIWKAMKASVPELGGSDIDGDDDGGDDDGDSAGSIPDDDDDDADGASDGGGSLAGFLEDADDLLSDADPPGLLAYASGSGSGSGSASEGEGAAGAEDEWQGFGAPPRKRARADAAPAEGARRKRRRGLPTFASYEEYAEMIDREPEDNV